MTGWCVFHGVNTLNSVRESERIPNPSTHTLLIQNSTVLLVLGMHAGYPWSNSKNTLAYTLAYRNSKSLVPEISMYNKYPTVHRTMTSLSPKRGRRSTVVNLYLDPGASRVNSIRAVCDIRDHV